MVNRRIEEFRSVRTRWDGRGPEEFIQVFADFGAAATARAGYPNAEVDLSGNRAIKFVFNELVE